MSSLAKNYKRRNLSFDKGKGSFLYTKLLNLSYILLIDSADCEEL